MTTPQAMLQNQALFRRIERSIEETAKKGLGMEVTVVTLYNQDSNQVTFQQLIDREVITDKSIIKKLEQNDKPNAITLSQMAPDTYSVYFLTQTGSVDIATKDSREDREKIETMPLKIYGGEEVNKLLGDHLKLAITVLQYLQDELGMAPTEAEYAPFYVLLTMNSRAATPLRVLTRGQGPQWNHRKNGRGQVAV